MSKPVFSDLFAFHGRRNRQSFLLYSIAAFIGATSLVSCMCCVGMLIPADVAMDPAWLASQPDPIDVYEYVGAQTADVSVYTVMIVLGLCAIYVPLLVANLAVSAQRCRDFGWTGWAILLQLVPIFGWLFLIALFFVPGTHGPNRYGPDPRATKR